MSRFLLVKLILDHILELTTLRQVQNALELQPFSLHQAFEASLDRIDAQPPAKRKLARRLLSWITFAKRSLRIEEVVCAFAVEEDMAQIQSENLVSADLLVRVCVGLVILDENYHTVDMVHSSAYEFFRSSLPSQDADLDIAQTCLRYLTMRPLNEGPCQSSRETALRLEQMAFLSYSAKHWGKHLQEGHVQNVLEDQVLRILDNENLLSSSFQILQYLNVLKGETSDAFFDSIPTGQDALHVAALWNLVHIAKILLQRGMRPSTPDSHKWTQLHWACSNGHYLTARVLVENGADVDAMDSQGWTPLFWAAFIGDLDTVCLLLSCGANYLLRSELQWTALHWAISRENYEVAEALLNHHSESRSQSEPQEAGDGGIRNLSLAQAVLLSAQETRPIIEAADSGNTAIFDLLVAHLHQSGAAIRDAAFNEIWSQERFDHPISRNPWRTWTKAENALGLERAMMKSLDSRSSSSSEKSATKSKSLLLMSAIKDSRYTVVEMLIKVGADVNYGHLDRPLHFAALKKDPAYTRLLLQNGADPEKVGRHGWTALHQAIMNGFVDTIKAIIDGGGNVNKQVERTERHRSNSVRIGNYFYRCGQGSPTPLMLAYGFAFQDRSKCSLTSEVISLLLAHGADPRVQDNFGMTVLHYAAIQPFLPLVRLLIEAGAKNDVLDNHGRAPLHFLARYPGPGCSVDELTQIIQLLVRDPNGRIGIHLLNLEICTPIADSGDADSSSNPLQSQTPKPDIVSRVTIRDKNATSISPISEQHETPISIALKNRCWKVFEVFWQLGATIPDEIILDSILERAVKGFQPNVVKILIKNGAHTTEGIIMMLVELFPFKNSADDEGEKTDEDNYNIFSMDEREDLVDQASISDYKSELVSTRGEAPAQDIFVQTFRDILAELVSTKANVNYIDVRSKLTPLGLAAKSIPYAAIILELLNSGADAYVNSPEFFDPTLTALISGNHSAVCCLMKYASKHARPNHWSEYLSATTFNDSESISVICTCLKRAGHIDRTNIKGRTLLHMAAVRGDCQLIQTLLQNGADPRTQDSQGWLPIHRAGFAGRANAVECLLSSQYSEQALEWLNLPDKDPQAKEVLEKQNGQGETMLQQAVRENNTTMVHHMLEVGAELKNDIKTIWGHGVPLLYHAAENGLEELARILLSHGAPIEASDRFGWRPLHAASYKCRFTIVKMLVQSGADVCATTSQWSKSMTKPTLLYEGNAWTGQALHLAAMGGDANIVRFLLDSGANVNASTGHSSKKGCICVGHGPSALHLALDTGTFYGRNGQSLDEARLDIAEMLVQAGADTDGVADHLGLEQVLQFKNHSGLWDVLRAAMTPPSPAKELSANSDERPE